MLKATTNKLSRRKNKKKRSTKKERNIATNLSYYARKRVMGDISRQSNIPSLPKKYDVLALIHGSASVILQYAIGGIALKRPATYLVQNNIIYLK